MGRAPCCEKKGLKKGPWTPEEDQKLLQYIEAHEPGNWRSLPKHAGLERCGKSCRLRWTNYLRPDIKRGRFSFEEEETIIQLHSIMGNKWSAIAARLPGRTDNEIKNYWNTHIRKRLLRMGIDPVTHTPRLDLLDLSSILSSNLCNNNASLLNLSSLMGLASQPFLNPDLLKLATTLFASNQENPNFPQQNQLLYNPQMQNQLVPTWQHNLGDDQFQNQVQEVPSCTTSLNVTCPVSSNLDQTQFTTQPNYTSNSMQQTFDHARSSHTVHDQLGNSSLESMHNDCNQNFCFDSVKSSPLSGATPLNSSSTFINSSSEEERESYCSSLFKFDIPEGFDISEFL